MKYTVKKLAMFKMQNMDRKNIERGSGESIV